MNEENSNENPQTRHSDLAVVGGSAFFNEDNMLTMKRYPDKFFNLAICDPPYGISISQDLAIRGQTCKKNGYRQWQYKEWDSSIPTEAYFKELIRVSKNQIIWGGNYFTEHLPPSRCWLIWDKGQRDFSFADAELAWTSFESSVRVFDYARGKLLTQGKIHPTEKPIDLYRWILQNYAKEGDLILDTHLGSGSIAIACEMEKFAIIGSEIDTDYFKAMEARLKNFKSQTKLW